MAVGLLSGEQSGELMSLSENELDSGDEVRMPGEVMLPRCAGWRR